VGNECELFKNAKLNSKSRWQLSHGLNVRIMGREEKRGEQNTQSEQNKLK